MHNIRYFDYDEKVNKDKVVDQLEKFAQAETFGEGGGGLPSRIRWLDRTFDTYDEAVEYIEQEDQKTWYNCMAVKYHETKRGKEPKKLIDLRQRVINLRQVANQIENEPHFKDAKSQYVGCKKCGSKLNKDYIGNICPVCRNDLRPESTLKKITRSKEVLKEAQKKLEKEERDFAKSHKGKVRWLVKIEYHT